MTHALSFGRRTFLGAGAIAAGATLSGGLPQLFADAPGAGLNQAACLRALHESLDAAQRAQLCLPVDHPSRQVDNTGIVRKGAHAMEVLRPPQRALLRQLFASTLSDAGRLSYAPLLALEAAGLEGVVLTLYGQPGQAGYHAVINGGHLLMRTAATGASAASGALWNGPLAYGHQVGDGQYRLPGNTFLFQAEAANRFHAALSEPERTRVRVARAPAELLVQVQEQDGRFDGARLGELSEAARAGGAALLNAVLGSFDAQARADAYSAIEHHGGVSELRVALYEDHAFYPDMTTYGALSPQARAARQQDPFFQVFRIEGPGTLIHFRGYPHLHAYLQLAREPRRQHVGETLAHTPALLADGALRQLIYTAMRAHSGAPLACYGTDIHARFCPGPVTTGLVYALEPYDNRLAVVSVRGAQLAQPARAELLAQGTAVQPEQRYRIVTTQYLAGETEFLGEPERVDHDPLPLRDLLIAHIRRHGVA